MKTEFFRIRDVHNQKNEIEKIASFIKNGEVVAIPTETVYGLAADAFNENAVKKIFEAKGRPSDNPLIVHISKLEDIYLLAEKVPEKAIKLAEKYWPGPLTIILPKKKCVSDVVSGNLPTVAVRFPSHKAAQAIIEAAGTPLAAPSANISGFPSPTCFQYVEDDMTGRVSAIVDGGDCECGIESTVITLATEPPTLLRPGAVTPEQLREVLGEIKIDKAVLNPLEKNAVASSPGMKYKHYSPKAALSIVKGNLNQFVGYVNEHKSEADFVLCFEGEEDKMPLPSVTFGMCDDSFSQAKRIFDALRELDEKGAKKVFVRKPYESGVGLGVCNRLYRAAAFRFLNDEKEKKGVVLGLSGASGSGKSFVAAYFTEKGAVTVDADKIAREITAKGSPVLEKLALAFGEDILSPDGELNRRKLASRAFADEEKTALLTSITHPEIIKRCKEHCETAANEGKTVILDAPLLFSSGLNEICDYSLLVFAPEQVRIERIRERDKISDEEIKKRFSAQLTEMSLAEKADFKIKNYHPYDVYEEIRRVERKIFN